VNYLRKIKRASGNIRPGIKQIGIAALAILLVFSSVVPVAVAETEETITLFSDVSLDYWAFEPIYKLVSAEVLTGYPDGTFLPSAKITRAEISAMLCRGFDVEPVDATSKFTDTGAAAWAEKYINPLTDEGIFLGVGKNLFDPNSNITNAEVAKLMVRLIERFNPEAELINTTPIFSDEEEIADWAKDSAKKAIEYGVMSATMDNKFNPKEVLTRDKLADIILKTMETIYEKEYGIKTIVEYGYGDWIRLEGIIEKETQYCDNITKRCIIAYGYGEHLYNPIENNPNAKWTRWYSAIWSSNQKYQEELEKNGIVYNEEGKVIMKLETKEGPKGSLYRVFEDKYTLQITYYEIREKNIEKIVYPGTM